MKNPTTTFTTLGVAGFAVLGSLVACSSIHSGSNTKERDVTLQQMTAPARATVTREVGGGQVDKITEETERGRIVYDVEATVQGRHMEYLVGALNGELLGTEVPIEFDQLPQPVRTAAEQYFGATDGLTVMKGVEYGETQYEIEGLKNGKRVEVTFDPSGKARK